MFIKKKSNVLYQLIYLNPLVTTGMIDPIHLG